MSRPNRPYSQLPPVGQIFGPYDRIGAFHAREHAELWSIGKSRMIRGVPGFPFPSVAIEIASTGDQASMALPIERPVRFGILH